MQIPWVNTTEKLKKNTTSSDFCFHTCSQNKYVPVGQDDPLKAGHFCKFTLIMNDAMLDPVTY